MVDKIDIVYLWVNGNDPLWRKKRELHSHKYLTDKHWNYSNVEGRFRDNNELKYSLRSLTPYLEQIGKIFIITDDQHPEWMPKQSINQKVKILSHKELMKTERPTYASSCIESYLHHIDNLSEHFLYFNDDIFLGNIDEGLRDTFWRNNKTIICIEDINDRNKHIGNERIISSQRSGCIIGSKLPNYCHKSRSFSHGMPFALKRSKLYEMKKLFPNAFHEVRQLVFRKSGSPPLISDTYFRWQEALNKTVEVRFNCRLINSGSSQLAENLLELHRNKSLIVSFCINDTLDNADNNHPNLEKVRSSLDTLYPYESPFEKIEQNNKAVHA